MFSSLYSRLQGLFTKTPKPIIPTVTATTTSTTPKISPPSTTTTTTTNSTIPKISPPSTTTKSKSETPHNISSLVKKFKKDSRSERFRRQQNTYEATVRRLASGNHFSAIESILEHQKKYKESITDEGFAVRLISLYWKAKMFDNARKLFDELPSLGCNRTVMSFNALIDAGVNSKKYDKVSELFTKLPEILSIKPDTVSYNIVIKAFCEMGSLDSAITVLDEMEKNGLKPNLVTYNTILNAYYKSNRVSDAETLWGLMKDKNVVANVRSYNIKLRGLIGCNRVSEAVELMKEMEEKELKPDVFSYSAIIKGFANVKNLEEAKKWYGKMVEDGCVPDHVIFVMLIQIACDKSDFSYALELCKNVIDLKIHIYHTLMQRVVDGLAKNSSLEEANELVELVDSSSVLRCKLKMPAVK